ncbi:hypothetical protein E2562_016669 [Oryza meyeriana var. granulata]|uniref:Uncharacterized protein n=1 Tax=Oryza meyeriana var. granulata TaxID=110450 RepID=A0A6G1EL93_9ORYZ|nr:hypothetical protein E2562_016669 [Oryza meyeriana var. granulata]
MPTGAMKRLFVESSSNSGGREATAGAVLCAPRPRRVQVHPCSADLILGPPPFLLSSNNSKKQREGESKAPEDLAEEEGSWALFGGSPPARADNPLVHDPHFLLNQRPHAAATATAVPDLSIFDHRSHHSHLVPAYSNSNSSSSSFAPSFAPAVRIQGFDVAACRSSHSSGGGRVLSARA